MLPRLVITTSEKAKKAYVDQMVREHGIGLPHVFRFEPEEGTFGIDQARLVSSLFLTKFDSLRLIIVDSFDLATIEAQNALLKLLEEKTENVQFLLFSSSAESVLSTIRSRVRTLVLRSENPTLNYEAMHKLVDELHAADFRFLNNETNALKTKEEVLERIDEIIGYLEILLHKKPAGETTAILKKALATRKEVQTYNVNPQFAYDNLLIFISKLATMIK